MTKANILIVDDNIDTCQLLDELLRSEGYATRYAHTGQEGIEQVAKDACEVVLIDLKLPDMNGIDVFKEIKKISSDVVAIVITGYPSHEDAQRAYSIGAFDYLTKPFELERISFSLKKAVDFQKLMLSNKNLVRDLQKQNIILEKNLEEKIKNLSLVFGVGQDIASCIKLDDVLQTVVNRVVNVMDLEICSVLLINEETEELEINCASGLSDDIIQNTKIKMGEKISGWVAQRNEAVLVENIESNTVFSKQSHEKYYTKSFISVPIAAKGKIMGVININNKKSKDSFVEDDLNLIKGIANEAAVAIENARLYEGLVDLYSQSIQIIVSAIDLKDHYTEKHTVNVMRYSVNMAKSMSLNPVDIEMIREAARLHSIGKIGIEDYILLKPGKLTEEEWEKIRTIPLKSAELIQPANFIEGVTDIVRQYRERFDGKGYPYGVRGENITLGARIMAVADSFDAMTSDRPYRVALSMEKAIEEIKKQSGSQFDPHVVEIFMQMIENDTQITNKTKGDK